MSVESNNHYTKAIILVILPVNKYNFNFLHSISNFCPQFHLSTLSGIDYHVFILYGHAEIFACVLLIPQQILREAFDSA